MNKITLETSKGELALALGLILISTGVHGVRQGRSGPLHVTRLVHVRRRIRKEELLAVDLVAGDR